MLRYLIEKMRLKIAILLSSVFLIFGIITLSDYGINWDTINHLPRGQAYLHYFLTGNKNFLDLPKYFDGWQTKGQWYWQDPEYLKIKSDLPGNDVPARSIYQIDAMDFNYFLQNDGDGHPPLSDILSALFNEVFFRRLKLINDVDSYRIYGLLLASLTVGVIFYWASGIYGFVSALVAAMSLSLYPLFWAESHFNTEKDIPETAYWTFFMYSFWKGITTKNWKWILLSSILFGLALGTKFNIVFSVLVIGPWFLYQLFSGPGFYKNLRSFLDKKLLLLNLLCIPLIGLGILILTWPYLWGDPISGVMKMVGFYKTIGSTSVATGSALGISLFPVKWIITTTPVVTLALTIIGLLGFAVNFKKEKNSVVLLFVLWLIIPVLRVVAPGSSTYGGVRQIMEFIPAMAFMSGYGFNILSKNWNKKFSLFFGVLLFLPITFKLISIHPNENVYFNSLIGGLKGAKEKNLPFWGFSFGSPYRQAAVWLNKNTEKGSGLAYTYDLIPNMPRIWLRTDIDLYNAQRSGFLRKGEYAMGIIYQGTSSRSYYEMYLEKFMNPVYEVKVDDTSILKIWKNDPVHLKKEYFDEKLDKNISFSKNSDGLVFDLGKVVTLSHLDMSYRQTSCSALKFGVVQTSLDGATWLSTPGVLPEDWRLPVIGEQPKNGKMIEPFVGQKARFVKFILNPSDTCLKNIIRADMYYFD